MSGPTPWRAEELPAPPSPSTHGLSHGAFANKTSKARSAITTDGTGPQLRQIENYTRGLRPEVMARTSPEMLRRLGFALWNGYGHTGNPDEAVTSAGSEVMGELG
jgi:hypothetical protein